MALYKGRSMRYHGPVSGMLTFTMLTFTVLTFTVLIFTMLTFTVLTFTMLTFTMLTYTIVGPFGTCYVLVYKLISR